MITSECNEFRREGVMYQAINDQSGIWATVNVVSNRDCKTAVSWGVFEVTVDLVNHAIKQIDAAVNIADHVHTFSIIVDQCHLRVSKLTLRAHKYQAAVSA